MKKPYPLQWPAGRTRTKAAKREHSRFGTKSGGSRRLSVLENAKLVQDELRQMGASHVVITSDLPTRPDGLPYSTEKAEDPGIAVWFVKDGRERVFACDAWLTHAENLRAIALSIGAMRGLDRWGMADVVDLAMAGFAALPPGSSSVRIHKHWRELFLVSDMDGLSSSELLGVVKARHRKLIASAHPDAGGNLEDATELNVALAEAEAELGG